VKNTPSELKFRCIFHVNQSESITLNIDIRALLFNIDIAEQEETRRGQSGRRGRKAEFAGDISAITPIKRIRAEVTMARLQRYYAINRIIGQALSTSASVLPTKPTL